MKYKWEELGMDKVMQENEKSAFLLNAGKTSVFSIDAAKGKFFQQIIERLL